MVAYSCALVVLLPAWCFECGDHASVQWKAQRTVKLLKVPGNLWNHIASRQSPYNTLTKEEAVADSNHSSHEEKHYPKHGETNSPNTKSMLEQVSLGLLLMEFPAWHRKQNRSQIRNQGSENNFWIAHIYLPVVSGEQRLNINFYLVSSVLFFTCPVLVQCTI